MSERGLSKPELLRKFVPFQKMDEHQLLLLASQMEVRVVPPGTELFQSGDIDSLEYFLGYGALELTASDGGSRVIEGEDTTAQRQIARLRPRQYTASTMRESQLFVIDADTLEQLEADQNSEGNDEMEAFFIESVADPLEAERQELLAQFRTAVKHNTFVLPSLPEVALSVREAMQNENTSADQVAVLVNADPAIAAKLIRAANSSIYHGAAQCETTRNAVVRLGLNNTRQLVVSFALRDLFKSKYAGLTSLMTETWEHSVEVAAISFVISKMTKGFAFSDEELMLAGLLHNVGVIAILAFIENKPALIEDVEKLSEVITHLRGEAGACILEHWKFPAEFVQVAREVMDWKRDHKSGADMCDIVQIAKLQSYMRNRKALPMRMDQVPAFRKLPLGELTPELTIQILDDAKELIGETKSLLIG